MFPPDQRRHALAHLDEPFGLEDLLLRRERFERALEGWTLGGVR